LRSYRYLWLLVMLVVACCATHARAERGIHAQDTSRQGKNQQVVCLKGIVTTTQDNAPSGVAGITVKLTHEPQDGSPTLTAVTDENGQYGFVNLPSGTYSITIEVTGFKVITKSVVVVAKQQTVQDFSLQLNTVSEKVEVSDTATAMSTETAAAPPATVTNTESRRGCRRFLGLTGVGLAQPRMGAPVTIATSGSSSVPIGSTWTMGFRETRPRRRAVSSPSMLADQACAAS